MDMSLVQTLKVNLVDCTGLSRDTLHVYVGLAIFLVTCALSENPRRSPWPLLMVLLAVLLGEAIDRRDDLASVGHWNWRASLHDLWNTLFWPLLLAGLLRWTRLFAPESR